VRIVVRSCPSEPCRLRVSRLGTPERGVGMIYFWHVCDQVIRNVGKCPLLYFRRRQLGSNDFSRCGLRKRPNRSLYHWPSKLPMQLTEGMVIMLTDRILSSDQVSGGCSDFPTEGLKLSRLCYVLEQPSHKLRLGKAAIAYCE
jgi:hypothetical protein